MRMKIPMHQLGLGQTFATTTGSGGATVTDPSVNNAADLANIMAGGAGGSVACPCSSCAIVPGVCDTNIYLAIGAVVFGFIFMGMKK
jgi:hypothetical protein